MRWMKVFDHFQKRKKKNIQIHFLMKVLSQAFECRQPNTIPAPSMAMPTKKLSSHFPRVSRILYFRVGAGSFHFTFVQDRKWKNDNNRVKHNISGKYACCIGKHSIEANGKENAKTEHEKNKLEKYRRTHNLVERRRRQRRWCGERVIAFIQIICLPRHVIHHIHPFFRRHRRRRLRTCIFFSPMCPVDADACVFEHSVWVDRHIAGPSAHSTRTPHTK